MARFKSNNFKFIQNFKFPNSKEQKVQHRNIITPVFESNHNKSPLDPDLGFGLGPAEALAAGSSCRLYLSFWYILAFNR